MQKEHEKIIKIFHTSIGYILYMLYPIIFHSTERLKFLHLFSLHADHFFFFRENTLLKLMKIWKCNNLCYMYLRGKSSFALKIECYYNKNT